MINYKPKTKTGKIDGDSLQSWFNGKDFIDWLNLESHKDIHGLIEYVYRFTFANLTGILIDLEKKEISNFGLKGRIFWNKGQVEWRRIEDNQFSILIIMEDEDFSILPKNLIPNNVISSNNIDETIINENFRNLILWGEYKNSDKGYFEKRVSGSEPIDYPDVIKNSGEIYPVLKIKEYLNDKNEIVLWRFVKPLAMSEKSLEGS